MSEQNPKAAIAVSIANAAKVIEIGLCEIGDYKVATALQGLDALVGDIRNNIKKICELAK